MSKFQLETDDTKCVVTWTQFTYLLFFCCLFFVVGGGMACVVVTLIAFEEMYDPYTMNLWPVLLAPVAWAVWSIMTLVFAALLFGTTRLELSSDGLTTQTNHLCLIKLQNHQIKLADIDYFEHYERPWYIGMIGVICAIILESDSESYYSIRVVLRKRMRVFFWIKKSVHFIIPCKKGFETLDVQLNNLLRELQKKSPASK